MHVDDVVLPETEDAAQGFPKLDAPGKARLRSVRIYRLTLADANDMRLLSGAGNIRRDDVDLVSVPPRLSGEEVHVLADSAEMRIVVLGDERDAQRPRVLDMRRRQRASRHQLQPARMRQFTR